MAEIDDTGPAIGLAGDGLVAMEACDGLPCGMTEVNLSTGARASLGEAVGPAAVTADGSGLVVVAPGGGLGVVPPSTGAMARGVPGSVGLAPLIANSTADSGMEAPPGRIAVAPGGRVDDPSAVRFLDPSALSLTSGEVVQ